MFVLPIATSLAIAAYELLQYSIDLTFGTHLFGDAVQSPLRDVIEDIIFDIIGLVLATTFLLARQRPKPTENATHAA